MPNSVADPSSLPQIARRMRCLRMATAETQTAFCQVLGLNKPTWNGYESGYSRPSIDVVSLLRKRFGVSSDWVFFGDEALMPAGLLRKIHEAEATDALQKKRA